MVLNARSIPECMDSLAELPIRKVYLRGWSERAIADRGWDLMMEATLFDFDWLWVVSDDVIVRPQALEAVRALAVENPVVTGYSQRSHSEWVVNLTAGPLAGDFPLPAAYAFREFREVVSWPSPSLPTWFAGMSLTGMSRGMWMQFPFGCFGDPGYASDFHLSKRLQDAVVPIVAARDAFLYHWRHDWISTNNQHDQSPQVGAEEIVWS